MVCDHCEKQGPVFSEIDSDLDDLKTKYKNLGWVWLHHTIDLCPGCAKKYAAMKPSDQKAMEQKILHG